MRLVVVWGYKLMAMFMTELLAGIITSTFHPRLPVLLTQVCPIPAVQIQVNRRSHHLLNSRAEFNRCALPRIALKVGLNDTKSEKISSYIAKKRRM